MAKLRFDHLFTGSAWLHDAVLTVDDGGILTAVQTAADLEARSDEAVEHFRGCALPGIPNLHSHAHQRAMAGLAESSGAVDDSFWTWREVMYLHVGRFTPDDMQAVAAQLYVEMLEAGYTAVGEFQYLHHDPAGEPYDELAEMSLRCHQAARQVGIGITHLPVLYSEGGFAGLPPTLGQRRFLNDVPRFLRLVERLEKERDGSSAVGVAPHSLRAVSPQDLQDINQAFAGRGPIHLHIAEQGKEVEDCLAWSNQRPVEWLLDHQDIDASWCLIHATHMTDAETRALAATGAVVGLCPTTEANLGDGMFNAEIFRQAEGRFGIGSDSHISVSPVEELRWLEYGQRLRLNARNLSAGGAGRSTGRQLLKSVLAGGAQACGRDIGEIAVGKRADVVVLDTDHPLLCGRFEDEWLDSWLFSGNQSVVRHVVVGGDIQVREGRHRLRDEVAATFRKTLEGLRS